MQANSLGIIKASVDTSNGFGSGTYNATIDIQKKYKLEVDGIAGKNTITALRNAINTELDKLKKSKSDHNSIIAEVVAAVNKLKVWG